MFLKISRLMIILRLFAVLTSLLPLSTASAATAFDCNAPAQAKDLLSKIESRYGTINDLSAGFSQESYLLGADERRYSIGTVKFLKPGKMDWLYGEPDIQRFVADGKNFWWYQPALSQVTVTDFKAGFSSDLPVSFLLGLGKLTKSFKLETACLGRRGIVAQLSPLDRSESLDRFALVVDASDFTPIGAKIIDAGGNETTIVFNEYPIINSNLPDERFRFDPPKGTDVVDQRGATSSFGPDPVPADKKSIGEHDIGGRK